MTVTRRERILRCFEFRHPDRMPLDVGYYPGALIRHGQALIDLLNSYPNDFRPEPFPAYSEQLRDLDPDYRHTETDPWGCVWENRHEGILGMPIGHPLADLSALSDYAPPRGSPTSGPEFEQHRAAVSHAKQTDIVQWAGPWVGGLNLFERMQWLRGYEALMGDLAEGRPETAAIADMIVEANLGEIVYGGRVGADVAIFADDWGTQDSLMIRPTLWREFFKPRYARMFDACREQGLRVSFHSDGQILEIVPDLIEIGVEILRPQFSCLDMRAMASLTRGRVTVFMDPDRQYTLPLGTPAEVRSHIAEIIDIFGLPEGGLVGRADIGPDVPLENAKAMLDALVEFGRLE